MTLFRASGALAIAVVFAIAFVRANDAPPAPGFVVPAVPSASPRQPPGVDAAAAGSSVTRSVVSSGATAEVHSASVVETSAGHLLAIWYGGSREGARDVALFSARFDPASGAWADERVVTTREATGRELGRYIRKLGNPMVMADASGRLLLFYVSVSVGGWSGSAINVKVSDDGGGTWSEAERLVTSPFTNISTLVRNRGVLYEDGSIGVPAYHELIGKFGELLRVTEDGRVWSKTRIGWGRDVLQPALVPFTETDAVVLLRQSGADERRIYEATTTDGGRTFTTPRPTGLNNPDAGIAAIGLGGRSLLVALNDSEQDRSHLELARSDDGGATFRKVYVVEDSAPGARLAYPTLLRTRDGELHLLYTWDRKEIRHLRFRGDWTRELGG